MSVKALRTKHESKVPQSEALPGMLPNSAGGHAFQVDCWTQLQRFLIMGIEGGTYYISENDLKATNLAGVKEAIATNAALVVDTLVQVSLAGRAPKNDYALYVLAMIASLQGNGDAELSSRRYALQALPQVARTATHLFTFVAFMDQMRGWGRLAKRAVADWYRQMDASKLAYQVVKYQERNGWSHRDVLRLAHPFPPTGFHQEMFRWITTDGESHTENTDGLPYIILGLETIKKVKTAAEACECIKQYGLPRECVPTQFLTDKHVWQTLLMYGDNQKMPYTAMLRNLATMTRVGLLEPLGIMTQYVVQELTNQERIQKARVHPLQLLVALLTYQQGHGMRGTHTWEPVQQISDALEAAFYLSFESVEPTGKGHLIGIDASGSMQSGYINGLPQLSAAMVAAVLAMVVARTESRYQIVAYTKDVRQEINISVYDSLRAVMDKIQRVGDSTDCAAPLRWALDRKLPGVDVFVNITDNETWIGKIHPAAALRLYREKYNPEARMAVLAVQGNQFSIADPKDAGMLDIVGFDAAMPSVLRQFTLGEL